MICVPEPDGTARLNVFSFWEARRGRGVPPGVTNGTTGGVCLWWAPAGAASTATRTAAIGRVLAMPVKLRTSCRRKSLDMPRQHQATLQGARTSARTFPDRDGGGGRQEAALWS